MQPNTVESGGRLAGRYRLEELLAAHDGFATWRAVDEKLSRHVSVYVLPADHARAEAVLDAARAAALVPDVRFLQILDANEDAGFVYVVSEWMPAGRELSAVLRESGPLPPADAAKLVREVCEAIASAHGQGQAHLRLGPENVVRTDAGQVKVIGLRIEAVLHDTTTPDPQNADTWSLGALLYATLTARWPDGPGHGLPGAPHEHGRLCSPRQVRAGVPSTLDEVAMRALANGTSAGAGQIDNPAALAAALAAATPRHRPSRTPPPATPAARTTTFPSPVEPPQPVPRSSRTARLALFLVAALVATGLGLLGWQVADSLLDEGANRPGGTQGQGDQPPAEAKPIAIQNGSDFDPHGDPPEENPGEAAAAIDGDPETTWTTLGYDHRSGGRWPSFGNLKPGIGYLIDLGGAQEVRSVQLDLPNQGQGAYTVELRASTASSAPSSEEEFEQVKTVETEPGTATIEIDQPVTARHLLIWFTDLPLDPDDNRHRGGITEVEVRR